MLKLLGELKGYLKRQEVETDNVVFRLHHTFTTVLLLGCSLVITANQFVGSPIQCLVDNALKKWNRAINTYCWITSTFTMPDDFNRRVGVEVAHPGVANDFGDEGAKKYYTYYQWVCFALFFQAVMCYTPKYIWDILEGGLMKSATAGLKIAILHNEELAKKKKALIDYLLKHYKFTTKINTKVQSSRESYLWEGGELNWRAEQRYLEPRLRVARGDWWERGARGRERSTVGVVGIVSIVVREQ
ncbi:Innexin inx1 [Homalodisca vitripennis]|nr:Innexin inx1 [Homalodisca vitripennis]